MTKPTKRSTFRERRRAARETRQRTTRIVVSAIAMALVAIIAYAAIQSLATPKPSAVTTTTASGLQIEALVVGSGQEVKAGDTVSVHYTGWLEDGTKFDSSVDRGQPFEFTLGAGGVIQGWDEGVAGIRVGGKRKLTIPPELGYGEPGYPPVIPQNATRVFEVEVLDIK